MALAVWALVRAGVEQHLQQLIVGASAYASSEAEECRFMIMKPAFLTLSKTCLPESAHTCVVRRFMRALRVRV